MSRTSRPAPSTVSARTVSATAKPSPSRPWTPTSTPASRTWRGARAGLRCSELTAPEDRPGMRAAPRAVGTAGVGALRLLAVSGALRVVVRGAQLVAAERALSPAWVTIEGHSPMLADRRADKGSHL